MSYHLLKKILLATSLLALALVGTACDKTDETGSTAPSEVVNATAPAEETPPQAAEEPAVEPVAEDNPAEDGYILVSGNIKFNRFNIEIGMDAEVDNYKTLSILHDGKPVSTATDAYRTVEISDRVNNYPVENCETLSLEMFTGGANCCFGYYILSACPDADAAVYIDPIPGGMSADPKNLGDTMGYAVTDPSFMYYSTEEDGDDSITLSGAESPRLVRYVVFDVDRWRLDKRGEFTAAYRQLSAEADGLQADGPVPNPVSRAIYMSYYSYMAGDDPVAVKALLKTQLPVQYSHLSDVVFSDIEKAVTEYKPLEVMELTGK